MPSPPLGGPPAPGGPQGAAWTAASREPRRPAEYVTLGDGRCRLDPIDWGRYKSGSDLYWAMRFTRSVDADAAERYKVEYAGGVIPAYPFQYGITEGGRCPRPGPCPQGGGCGR
jgi:hypothetical protein